MLKRLYRRSKAEAPLLLAAFLEWGVAVYRASRGSGDPDNPTAVTILSCHDAWPYTKQAIDSYDQAIGDSYNHHLIIIDDCSSDESPGALGAMVATRTNFHFIRFRRNRGLTCTWNCGLRYALDRLHADYVFISNNDVIFPAGVFARLLAHLKGDADIRLIGPLSNAPGHQLEQQIRTVVPGYQPSDEPVAVQRTLDALVGNGTRPLPFINGFMMGFPRMTLEENIFRRFLGRTYYFDPRQKNTGNEDEFQKRLGERGIVAARDAFVFHYKDISQHRNVQRWTEVYRSNRLS